MSKQTNPAPLTLTALLRDDGVRKTPINGTLLTRFTQKPSSSSIVRPSPLSFAKSSMSSECCGRGGWLRAVCAQLEFAQATATYGNPRRHFGISSEALWKTSELKMAERIATLPWWRPGRSHFFKYWLSFSSFAWEWACAVGRAA